MMNFAVQKMAAIPYGAEAAGKAVRFVVVPGFTQRVVLTYVKVRCGKPDVLSVLQPVETFRFTAAAGSDTAEIADMPAEYEGKAAVIRFDGGRTLVTELGSPLVLELENEDGKSVIEGGLAVFVGV